MPGCIIPPHNFQMGEGNGSTGKPAGHINLDSLSRSSPRQKAKGAQIYLRPRFVIMCNHVT
jgi:hypothetical protein